MGEFLGAVFAGGRSSRFGSDKAAALLGDRPLIDHAIAALAPHVREVAVCGREIPGILSLADRPAPGMGPLGALNAALHHAAAHGFDAVLTTGCDMPAFPPALARALVGEGPAILQGQQLAGYWPSSLAPVLDAWLANTDNLAIRAWLDTLDYRTVTLPGLELPNINTPADLAALRGSPHRHPGESRDPE